MVNIKKNTRDYYIETSFFLLLFPFRSSVCLLLLRALIWCVQKILAEPELVILDEPTVGLDPLLREKYVMMTGQAAATDFT